MDFLTTIITSAAVSAALSAFLLWLVKSWLSERLKNAIKHEYDVRLESHKAVMQAQAGTELEKLRSDLSVTAAQQLEQLRYQVEARLDRAAKLHQREFEVLPEAWARLNDAFWTVRAVTSPLQSFPDLDRMSPPQVAEFVKGLDLPQWAKDELMSAADKSKLYQERIFWHRLDGARTKARDAYSYSAKSGIFVSEALRAKFDSLHQLVWEAITEHETLEESRRSGGNWRPQPSKCAELRLDGERLMTELEVDVRNRLHVDTTALEHHPV